MIENSLLWKAQRINKAEFRFSIAFKRFIIDELICTRCAK